MNKKILYIGNKLSKHGNTATSIETLGTFLEMEGYVVYYASSKKNQLLRMIDMIFTTIKRSNEVDFVMIDTYSTKNFWYAFVISQLCRLLHKKYIIKLHGGNLPYRLQKNPVLSDLIFKNACKITAPSMYLLDAFAKRNYDNLEYVPNSIDISKYPFRERTVSNPKLLWVRSFSKIYNPEMAIKVLYEVKKEYPAAELCMVGPDKENIMEGCKRLAQELNVKVLFTGKLLKEEWVALAETYSIFINTTHFDNTPVSIIEAMAIGLPVVSTNVGGIPFLITDMENGLLVRDNDADEMVKALKNLVQDHHLSRRLANNAREMVAAFDWQVVKYKWFEIFQK